MEDTGARIRAVEGDEAAPAYAYSQVQAGAFVMVLTCMHAAAQPTSHIPHVLSPL